jgi:hypothetical protein
MAQNDIYTCTRCSNEYVYYWGRSSTLCPKCQGIEKRKAHKQKCVDYKGGGCQICGYNDCLAALDFHHLDRATKEFEISTGIKKKWEVVVLELDKCVLLCANHHREVEAGYINL